MEKLALIELMIKNYGSVSSDEIEKMNKILDEYQDKIKLSGGRYYVWVPDKNGKMTKQLKKTRREDLEKAIVQYFKEMEGPAPKVNRNITIEDFWPYWVNYQHENPRIKPETFRRYGNDFKNHISGTEFSKMKVKDADYIAVEEFLKGLAVTYEFKKKAVQNISSYLKGLFKLALRYRLITLSPYDDCIDLKNRVYPFCPDEAIEDEERVLSNAKTDALKEQLTNRHRSARNRDYMPDYAIELDMYLGLRVGELAVLRWKNVNGDFLLVEESEHRIPHDDRPDEYVIGDTKNKKHRRVPIGNEARKVLFQIRQIQSEMGVDSEYIFADADGRIIAPDISKAAYRRGVEAGIDHCSIHAIRRTVSSRLDSKLPRNIVSHIMGHTEQVNRDHYDYDYMDAKQEQNAMDQLYA